MALVLAFCSAPLIAQTQDDKIQQLQNRLDELLRQANSIQTELNALKGTTPQPEEDLTKVQVVPTQTAAAPQPQPQAPQQPAPVSLTEVQTIANIPNPGASKVFNPDTSVIGNFLGKAGRPNPYEFGSDSTRPAFQLDEAEVAFQAFVDPYAKANFFLSASPEGLEIEEAYAQFVNLPIDITAKVGKFKAMFGKANTWHAHVRPWVDQPLVIHNFFGDEQFADSGVSVSKALPVTFAFVEATGEVYRGDVENVFGHHNQNDLAYNGHLKFFKDISENSNIEVGTSYARGTLPEAAGSNQFGGVDVTYRWKPLQQGLYKGLIYRFEGLVNKRDDFGRNPKGFYTSVDYQLAQRWFTGLRIDRADRLISGDEGMAMFADKGVSATLTFWPSEFSQVRGQLRHTSYGGLKSVNELLFQLQFAIGAHGAHTF
ncbi:MAG TPA: hypothetical protein VGK04_10810 [Thermoanaerobaculia bacterium]